MQIKKSGGRIFGANLTAAEKKAMDMEIKRQIAQYDRAHLYEADALILWILHEEFGFGEKRLRRFYDRFNPAVDELAKRYECEDDRLTRLCTYKRKQCGIDIEAWHREGGKSSEG